ncbi:MAG TPA: hypothetical protein VKA69_06375 [Desulfobacteria bacterium]|nr:hypothetical protein [Desulfobacteria bacterium]
MELLIIKKKNVYVRIKEERYLFVGLDKASVFPLEKLTTVQGHIKTLQARGFKNVSLYRLKMTEEPYQEPV